MDWLCGESGFWALKGIESIKSAFVLTMNVEWP